MVKIGTITGREVRPNRDGTDNRLMLQVQLTNSDDIQTVEYISLPGHDENPIDGTRIYILTVGESYKIGIAANDGIEPGMQTGEQRMYSLNDAGAIQAFINMLKTGIIEINGNADFAIRFNALDAALQLLVTSINAVLATKTDGGGSAGTLTLDISGAKVDEVKVS